MEKIGRFLSRGDIKGKPGRTEFLSLRTTTKCLSTSQYPRPVAWGLANAKLAFQIVSRTSPKSLEGISD